MVELSVPPNPWGNSDHIAVVLRAALEDAIAEGRSVVDAAQIATELAARSCAGSDPKVVPFSPKRRR